MKKLQESFFKINMRRILNDYNIQVRLWNEHLPFGHNPVFLSTKNSITMHTIRNFFDESMNVVYVDLVFLNLLSRMNLNFSIASLVPLLFRKPNWSCSNSSSVTFSKFLLRVPIIHMARRSSWSYWFMKS